MGEDNPYFFKGTAGEGIGSPHCGYDMDSQCDKEIAECITMLMKTDAGTRFIHESFHKNDANKFTCGVWFAWQNTWFGELIIKLIDNGKLEPLNSI